jgi:hypothetical protein
MVGSVTLVGLTGLPRWSDAPPPRVGGSSPESRTVLPGWSEARGMKDVGVFLPRWSERQAAVGTSILPRWSNASSLAGRIQSGAGDGGFLPRWSDTSSLIGRILPCADHGGFLPRWSERSRTWWFVATCMVRSVSDMETGHARFKAAGDDAGETKKTPPLVGWSCRQSQKS